ncbi:SDR family oxidoreductase [Paractinoplanes atraurantiacus]|uniref:Short-chain dehydrogenase involved in D-alanine esterification of teichoic acids n=1 Tax=Paractinoplanes atraurantiacus TaxID=1036182 RepID=A0A285JWB4_9ACTN|nr:SDR family NAD(P)-dependent oxidoreductase [Actinoplanes atraurantiacus]SNY64619.1 Short-chain dehydrogenase involved in D-alanine esterification of teichoic acids [Actinoplanes atraurantiacus]
MDITHRTVLIVGGSTGIGAGLGRRFAAAGSTVVTAARKNAEVEVDVTDPGSVLKARDAVLASHPELDVVVVSAGLMATEDLRDPGHFDTARTTVETNLLGTIRVIDAFTPHLIGRGEGAFVTVTSGIGFLPFPLMPTYAASKAGVHAYSEALRAQLDGTGVEVAELVPPAVATVPEAKRMNPHALDLEPFLDEVMEQLGQSPTPREILVKGVLMHRWAERDGTYDDLVRQRSAALAMLPGRS